MTTLGARAAGGVAAAAVAVGVAQLVGAAFGPQADVRTAVGSAVIQLTPGPVKEWAIQTFGTADKLVLSVAVLLVIAALAALAGILEGPRRPVGSAMIVAAGVLGCAAVLSRAGATAVDVIPTVAGILCGVAALRLLVSRRLRDRDTGDTASTGDSGDSPDGAGAGRWSRWDCSPRARSAAWAGVVITRLASSVSGDRNAFALPAGQSVAADTRSRPAENVALPSFVTANDDFYRIDTALSVPQLVREDWQLRIHGMVDREVTLALRRPRPLRPRGTVVTLTCVSNPVGGDLISNARLDRLPGRGPAGRGRRAPRRRHGAVDVDATASPRAPRSRRSPTTATRCWRSAMNGQPLPVEHGYPARLVVPGLYGYVSATKWVVDLEVTRFDRAEAYWTRLGWSARGPIKTESRIDVPRDGADVPAGPVTFGGVAWAQHRGVRSGRGAIDDGAWQPADSRRRLLERHLAAVEFRLAGRPDRSSTRSRCGPPTTPAPCRPPTSPTGTRRGDRLALGSPSRSRSRRVGRASRAMSG